MSVYHCGAGKRERRTPHPICPNGKPTTPHQYSHISPTPTFKPNTNRDVVQDAVHSFMPSYQEYVLFNGNGSGSGNGRGRYISVCFGVGGLVVCLCPSMCVCVWFGGDGCLCLCIGQTPPQLPYSTNALTPTHPLPQSNTAPQQPRKYRTRTFLAGNLDRVALRSHDQLEEGEGGDQGEGEEGEFECV